MGAGWCTNRALSGRGRHRDLYAGELCGPRASRLGVVRPAERGRGCRRAARPDHGGGLRASGTPRHRPRPGEQQGAHPAVQSPVARLVQWGVTTARRPRPPDRGASVRSNRRHGLGDFLLGVGPAEACHADERAPGVSWLFDVARRRTARHSATAMDGRGQAPDRDSFHRALERGRAHVLREHIAQPGRVLGAPPVRYVQPSRDSLHG